MAYYNRDEQETIYRYDPIDSRWYIYSSYPPQVRRILDRGEVTRRETDEEGRIIAVEARAESNQVRLFKPR